MEPSQPVVTIAIPVFNGGTLLDEALASASGQNTQFLEILCIDDGSTDDTLERLRSWQRRDGRVRILQNEKNLGIHATRCRAVREAFGQYLLYLDADDYLVGNIVPQLVQVAEGEQADIIHFFCHIRPAKGTLLQPFPWASPRHKTPLTNPKLTHAMLQGNIGHHLWGKFFRTDLYRRALDRMGKELETTRISYEEDLLHMGFIAPMAARYQPIPVAGYCHRKRPNSASRHHALSLEKGTEAFQNFCQIVGVLARALPQPYVSSLSFGSMPAFTHHHKNWQRWSPQELASRVHQFIAAYPGEEQGKAFSFVINHHKELFFTALPHLPRPKPKPLANDRPPRIAVVVPGDDSLPNFYEILSNLMQELGREGSLDLIAEVPKKVAHFAGERVTVHPFMATQPFRCECWQTFLTSCRPDICLCMAPWREHNYLDIGYLVLRGIPVIALEPESFWDITVLRSAKLHPIALRAYPLCAAIVCQSRKDVTSWRTSNCPCTVHIPNRSEEANAAAGQGKSDGGIRWHDLLIALQDGPQAVETLSAKC
ncbi:MAG: glycosyltransferase [Puniceicoccales bacterium]|jgi:hypothetical protein|nr:glycosyltransferase [Puniceicoccales bacterium]